MYVATRVTGDVLTNDLEISTGPIRVHNILIGCINAASQGPCDFEDADGNVIMTVMIPPAAETYEIGEIWLADNGLTIKAVNNQAYITVFYSEE